MNHPMIKGVTWTTFCECPACKEISLHIDKSTLHNQIHEMICDSCRHYETHDNPDYDPTPDEQGEPPVTIQEQCDAALNAKENGR